MEFSSPTPSSDFRLKVAAKLKNLNAKMYGAYWCSHCYNQKQTLGIEAYESFEYIESQQTAQSSPSTRPALGFDTMEDELIICLLF